MNQTKNTYSTAVRALARDSYDVITPAEPTQSTPACVITIRFAQYFAYYLVLVTKWKREQK